MILHTVQQRTEKWAKLRAGIVTASEIDAIVTLEFKLRDGAMLQTYLNKKLAERSAARSRRS